MFKLFMKVYGAVFTFKCFTADQGNKETLMSCSRDSPWFEPCPLWSQQVIPPTDLLITEWYVCAGWELWHLATQPRGKGVCLILTEVRHSSLGSLKCCILCSLLLKMDEIAPKTKKYASKIHSTWCETLPLLIDVDFWSLFFYVNFTFISFTVHTCQTSEILGGFQNQSGVLYPHKKNWTLKGCVSCILATFKEYN